MRVVSPAKTLARALTHELVLAVTLWGEARNERIEGKTAVACVVRNRVHDTHRWGRSYRTVCLQPWQFSCWEPHGGEANYQRVFSLVETLRHNGHPTDPVWRECLWLATGVVGDHLLDRVRGANHYHVASMSPRPSWAAHQTPVEEVGHHLFYRL